MSKIEIKYQINNKIIQQFETSVNEDENSISQESIKSKLEEYLNNE